MSDDCQSDHPNPPGRITRRPPQGRPAQRWRPSRVNRAWAKRRGVAEWKAGLREDSWSDLEPK